MLLMNKVCMLMVICACAGLAQERKIKYLEKRNTPEIQASERRYYFQRRAQEDIRCLVQSTPAVIYGSYGMFDALSRSQQADENNFCLIDQAQLAVSFYVGISLFCLGGYRIIDVCDKRCGGQGFRALCCDYCDICFEESYQILNHFSCNAVYQLFKLVQKKLTR
jgi:hypothetical protein